MSIEDWKPGMWFYALSRAFQVDHVSDDGKVIGSGAFSIRASDCSPILPPTNDLSKEPCQATHEEICDGALRHYRDISSRCCDWSSTVEHAVKFYREHGDGEIERLKAELAAEAVCDCHAWPSIKEFHEYTVAVERERDQLKAENTKLRQDINFIRMYVDDKAREALKEEKE